MSIIIPVKNDVRIVNCIKSVDADVEKEMCEIYSIGMELAILPYMKRMFPKQDVFRFYFFQLFSFFIYEAMFSALNDYIYICFSDMSEVAFARRIFHMGYCCFNVFDLEDKTGN